MAESAFGTIIRRGDGAEIESFTAIAEIKDVAGPELKRDTKDSTHHGSVDGWKEFVPGLKDGGELSFKVNLLHETITWVDTELAKDTTTNWQLVYPYESSSGKRDAWTFAGILTGFKPSEDTILEADITIKVSGKPVSAEITWPEA